MERHRARQRNFLIANEHIGKLYYNCSYVAIKSLNPAMSWCIEHTFFGSAQSLEKIQLIMANILTVFVLVFILFSVLSFWWRMD